MEIILIFTNGGEIRNLPLLMYRNRADLEKWNQSLNI